MSTSPPNPSFEWHPTLNGTVSLDDYAPGSHKVVWWLSECGHEYQTSINSKVNLSVGCPICNGKQILAGFNDLTSQNPTLAQQWHSTLNTVTPEETHHRSHTKVWWQCETCQHEWSQSPSYRTQRPLCPECVRRSKYVGYNTQLMAEWAAYNTEDPYTLTNSSTQQVLWECAQGHQWTARVRSRTRKTDTGCPECRKQEQHLLKNTRPQLWAQLKPSQPTLTEHVHSKHTGQLVWTHPDCMHEWVASIPIIGQTLGCPTCELVINVKKNPLSETLIKEWHPTKNGALQPEHVKASSNKKVWWLGECGHEWISTVHSRTVGGSCAVCRGLQVQIGQNDLETTYPHIAAQWHPTKNVFSPQSVSAGTALPIWWLCDKGHEWEAVGYSRTGKNEKGCPICWQQTFVSKAEKIITDYLDELHVPYITSDRSLLKGQEVDIYIPSLNLAIEYNGVYWHSEANGKGKRYHYDKWMNCKMLGVQLIQIWEDDWNRNPEQIKKMIAHKTRASKQQTIGARTTTVVNLTKAETETFLNSHHIQGYASGTHYLGLQRKGTEEIVAVLVLKKESGNMLNIIRYATAYTVAGGFTKLLTYAERTYHPSSFITFSDHCVSDGALYAQNGFTVDKELPPDYMYLVKGKREHKFGYRLKRFRTDSNLIYQEGLTERELAALNNLHRVWDAGKTRWIRSVKPE